jgi:hypothetical protein
MWRRRSIPNPIIDGIDQNQLFLDIMPTKSRDLRQGIAKDLHLYTQRGRMRGWRMKEMIKNVIKPDLSLEVVGDPSLQSDQITDPMMCRVPRKTMEEETKYPKDLNRGKEEDLRLGMVILKM